MNKSIYFLTQLSNMILHRNQLKKSLSEPKEEQKIDLVEEKSKEEVKREEIVKLK